MEAVADRTIAKQHNNIVVPTIKKLQCSICMVPIAAETTGTINGDEIEFLGELMRTATAMLVSNIMWLTIKASLPNNH